MVKAVPWIASLSATIGARCSRRAISPVTGAQTMPQVWRMMKAIFSAVVCTAPMIRSPSFSRSSSSVTTTISPRAKASMASRTLDWGNVSSLLARCSGKAVGGEEIGVSHAQPGDSHTPSYATPGAFARLGCFEGSVAQIGGETAQQIIAEISLSALGGGEGRGEVGESRALAETHLPLPVAPRRVPSLSPLKGGEGSFRALIKPTQPAKDILLGPVTGHRLALGDRDRGRDEAQLTVALRWQQRQQLVEQQKPPELQQVEAARQLTHGGGGPLAWRPGRAGSA